MHKLSHSLHMMPSRKQHLSSEHNGLNTLEDTGPCLLANAQAHFSVLLNSSEHDNHSRLVVPNHLPEVRDGGWSGTWRKSGVNKVQPAYWSH